MPTPQRLPLVDSDDGVWGDILRQYLMKEHTNNDTDNIANGGHKTITVTAGTTAAGTAPIKLTSGPLMTASEAGAIEFLSDNLYFTQTTSNMRKKVAIYDDSSGATGDIYYRNSSGYFTRLGVGSNGNVLTLAGGLPSWSSSTSGQTINLANNTLTGTTAQFNTALSDNDFATLAGTETLTNKTLTSPKINLIKDAGGATSIVPYTVASAVNYLQVLAGTTGNGISLQAVGTDTNIGAHIWSKGTGSINFRSLTEGSALIAQPVTSGVNYTIISGSATGNATRIESTGTDTNINMNLVTKGAGIVQANGVEIATISGTQTLTNKTLTTPKIDAIYDANGNISVSIASTASAVNFLQATNGATGGGVSLFASGSDTNISNNIYSKAAGTVNLRSNTNGIILSGVPVASAVNYLTITNSTTGLTPSITATGSDGSINLDLTPKGSGQVRILGVPVVTETKNQTLTNKTISGSSNTLSNTFTLTTTGTSGAASYDGTTLNIPQYPTGDVTGPASSTDDAIVRYNGTTGKLVQNSGATLNDSGDIQTGGKIIAGDYSYTSSTLHLLGGSGGQPILQLSRGSGVTPSDTFDFGLAGGGLSIRDVGAGGYLAANMFAYSSSSEVYVGQKGTGSNQSNRTAILSATTHSSSVGSNIGGPSLIVRGGGGTGTGTPGDILFNTFSTTTSGSTAQSSTTRVTIAATTGVMTIANPGTVAGSVVSIDSTQTLTNKTIASPVLSGTITGTYTLGGSPTFPSNIVTLTDLQTLTNKILDSATLSGTTVVPKNDIFELYNTVDQTTNYERVRQYWSGNSFTILNEAAGSGTARTTTITAQNTSLIVGSNVVVSRPGGTGVGNLFNVTSTGLTSTSSNQSGISITPVINQSGTASYTGLHINPTETATGSGAKNLIDAQVGGVSKFTVSNTGAVTVAAVGTSAGSLVSIDGTQTLTNKTLTTPAINNAATLSVGSLSGGTTNPTKIVFENSYATNTPGSLASQKIQLYSGYGFAISPSMLEYQAVASATHKFFIGSTERLAISGTDVTIGGVSAVTTTDSQTLTNKTLSSPVLSGTITGTYTLGGTPTFPSTVVTTTGSQTLTNKNMTSGTNTWPTFNQNTTGSAATLTTARNISLTGDVAGSTSFNGGSNVSITATVADDSHSHSISTLTDQSRLFNNMGDVHSTRSTFDAQGAGSTVDYGWRYVKGNTNGPGTNGASQYYSALIGLGNEYNYNSYGMQIAFPRNVSEPYISIRYEEAGALQAWQKISAGDSDKLGGVAASSYVSSTGTQTLTNKTIVLPRLDDLYTDTPTNLNYTLGSSSGNYPAFSPVPKYLWHDLLRFSRWFGAPIYETYSGSWSSQTLNTAFFNGKESQAVTVADGTTTTAARWTWNSASASYSSISWWILGFTYVAGGQTNDILVESSTNGSTWTTRHTSSSTASGSPVWLYQSPHSGDSYLRLTITSTAGQNIRLSSIRALSTRWGDQGGGSEYEYPYAWDNDQNITVGDNSPRSNGALNLGSTSTTTAAGGVYFGNDTNLYRSAANTLKTDDTLIVGGGTLAIGDSQSTANYIELQKTATSGESNLPRIRSDSIINSGSGNDLVLSSRSSSGGVVFETGNGGVRQLALDSTGKLLLGNSNDTNLYRSAANTLKTDDNLIVGTAGTAAGSVATIDGAQTLTNKTITSPRINTILDGNGYNILNFASGTTPTNYLSIANSTSWVGLSAVGSSSSISIYTYPKGSGVSVIYTSSGNTPTLQANGQDTNLDLNLTSKGTGAVQANGIDVVTISGSQTITNKNMTSGTNTWPTFNQSTTGNAATATTATYVTSGMPNNTDNYMNFRVIRNINTSTSNDGLYIGYGNSNNGLTRIFGGGDTTNYVTINTGGTLTAPGTVQGTRLISTQATGTAPLTVSSTTKVTNLNVDMLDGNQASAFPTLAGNNTFTGGNKITVQNSQDGGSNRGIWMWSSGDSNWGIYMSTAGAAKSLAGGTAAAGIDGRTSHGIRFRSSDSSTQIGFLWENKNDVALMQLTPNTGNLYTMGDIYVGNSTSNKVATQTGTETLTNKTLTSPIINGNTSINGDLTVDNGTNSIINVISDDGGVSGIQLYGDSQGTGYVEVGQSTSHGGGMYYNGDGSPAFASGEATDTIGFYRKSASVRSEVFYYAHNSDDVYFNGAISSGGVPVVTTTDTQTLTNKNLTSGTNTFPTFNQSTTGNAATATTATNQSGGTVNATTGTFTSYVNTDEIRNRTGTQLVINSGDSAGVATGQTGELVYLNAENGIEINSSPNNWGSGWAGRNTATINNSSGNSTFPGTIQGTVLISTQSTGTAPLTVSSTTKVTNLNADLLDDMDSSATATGSTIVARNSAGDIFGRYLNMSHGVSTRSSDTVFYSSTDDYIRKNNATGFKNSLSLDNVDNTADSAKSVASAAQLTTARTIALSGAATGTATSFNGSANITIPVTALNANDLNTGTVPDARLAGTYSGFTHKIDGSNTIFTTPNSGSSNSSGRTVYGLAEYRSNSSGQIGAIIFYAPNTTSSIMHQLEINGLLYNQNIVQITVQGYRTTGAWSDLRKISTGTVDVQVRWGVDPSGKNCLILGDVATSWSYPHLSIVRAMFSHSGASDAYATGWTVGVVTDLTGFTQVTSSISDSTMVGSISGNATTATTLQTARTIGGVSFNGSANINLPGVNTTGNQNTSGSAATLTTSRTFQTNLASTSSASFNGSANVTPGVTGTLAVGNGGTGSTNAASARSSLGLGTFVDGSVNGSPTSLILWTGTVAQYNAIGSKNSNTVYIVT